MHVKCQSGETADTLAALRMAKEKNITTMAIVNVVGSSIAREADKVFYTLAGPEISVATTKAYSAQLAAYTVNRFFPCLVEINVLKLYNIFKIYLPERLSVWTNLLSYLTQPMN